MKIKEIYFKKKNLTRQDLERRTKMEEFFWGSPTSTTCYTTRSLYSTRFKSLGGKAWQTHKRTSRLIDWTGLGSSLVKIGWCSIPQPKDHMNIQAPVQPLPAILSNSLVHSLGLSHRLPSRDTGQPSLPPFRNLCQYYRAGTRSTKNWVILKIVFVKLVQPRYNNTLFKLPCIFRMGFLQVCLSIN